MIWQGQTPKGNPVQMHCRDSTSDENICRLISAKDEYRLGPFEFEGVAIDVGAHIGSVSVPLLIDNPKLGVVAYEPIEDSVHVLRANVELNNVGDRAVVLPFAVGEHGSTQVKHGWPCRHRHVGNLNDGSTPRIVEDVVSLSLSSAYDACGAKMIALLKLDCEGCEWVVLEDPAIRYCEMIVGEFHSAVAEVGAERVQAVLADTHRVTFDQWNFWAVLK